MSSAIKIRSDTIPEEAIVRLGQRVRFTPTAFCHELSSTPKRGKPVYRSVEGTICYINRPHRYFTVSYEMQELLFLESFKF